MSYTWETKLHLIASLVLSGELVYMRHTTRHLVHRNTPIRISCFGCILYAKPPSSGCPQAGTVLSLAMAQAERSKHVIDG